jgi:hypothetical protein
MILFVALKKSDLATNARSENTKRLVQSFDADGFTIGTAWLNMNASA